MSEEEKKLRKKQERERKRQEARENAEKKKRFGLNPEKKRKLKLLIMKMAAENLKAEAERKANAKKNFLESKVSPLPELGGLNEAHLVSICKDLHKQIAEAEEMKYDMEFKIRRQDYEVKNYLITPTIQFKDSNLVCDYIDQRAHYKGQRHQGQVHKADIEESQQDSEQVCQAREARETRS